MAKFITVSIVLSLVLAINSAKIPDNKLNAHVAVVNNLDEYLSKNPHVKLLEPLFRDEIPSLKASITYRLGNRVNGK